MTDSQKKHHAHDMQTFYPKYSTSDTRGAQEAGRPPAQIVSCKPTAKSYVSTDAQHVAEQPQRHTQQRMHAYACANVQTAFMYMRNPASAESCERSMRSHALTGVTRPESSQSISLQESARERHESGFNLRKIRVLAGKYVEGRL